MSDLPESIRAQVIEELYLQAAELNWELLTPTDKKNQYRKWIDDPAVGGVLRAFFDDHRIGTWIKDTPMKEYSRAQEGFGPLAKFARYKFPGPEHLVASALGSSWSVAPKSVAEKPMHCIASAGADRQYVCWGPPSKFRDIMWSALKEHAINQIDATAVVTLQDGVNVTADQKAEHQALALHCSIGIAYVHRSLERSK